MANLDCAAPKLRAKGLEILLRYHTARARPRMTSRSKFPEILPQVTASAGRPFSPALELFAGRSSRTKFLSQSDAKSFIDRRNASKEAQIL